MTLTVEVQWLVAILLASIRIGSVFLLTPVLAMTQAPVQVRVFFVLGLAALLVTSLGVAPLQTPVHIGQLLEYAVHELVVGLAMAFGVFAAFAVFLLGGRILDFQMGFGVASLIDPATQTQTAMMGVILNFIAVMVFFILDGHHLLLRGLTYSFDQVPLGVGLTEISIAALVTQFGYMFSFAVVIVAPALFAILLTDVGLAVMARTMPQVNMFFVSIPLKILVGLLMTALSIRYMGPVMQRIFTTIFDYWEAILI